MHTQKAEALSYTQTSGSSTSTDVVFVCKKKRISLDSSLVKLFVYSVLFQGFQKSAYNYLTFFSR